LMDAKGDDLEKMYTTHTKATVRSPG